MAEVEKKKIVQQVYQAAYVLGEEPEATIGANTRELLIVAPHFQRAAFKAVKNTKDGETLVGLTKQNDAVV